MNLLDRAIKLAAEQDEPVEMNFVRKHALEQAEELGVSVRDAATRVFSNASGERGSRLSRATACAPPLPGCPSRDGLVPHPQAALACWEPSTLPAHPPWHVTPSPLPLCTPRRLLLLQRQPGCGELLLV